MRKRLSPAAHGQSSGIKLRKIGLSSLAIITVSAASIGVGINILSNAQKDTSATDNGMIDLGDMMTVNPAYEQYLADVEAGYGSNWDLIPSEYIPIKSGERRAYSSSRTMQAESNEPNLPSTYDLRDEGYATALKNQGADGICWAFAATSAMESYLLRKEGIDREFSPKQLDYLLASGTPYDSWIKAISPLDVHELGDGYNFYLAGVGFSTTLAAPADDAKFFARMQANDATLASYDSWLDYENQNQIFLELGATVNPYTKPMDYADVTADKSEYITTEYIDYVHDSDTGVIETVKQHVHDDGAVYVGTLSPGVDQCWDEATKTIINYGITTCSLEESQSDGSIRKVFPGHAMLIVGWDDEYSYTNPSDGTVEKGAFILQNSWGSSSLLEDYGVNSYELLVAKGIIDPNEFPQDRIQELNDYLANYDAYETVYLSYGHSDPDTTDYGLIETMEKNDYDKIYGVTMGNGYNGAKLGDQANEAIYEYTAGSTKEYISSVAVSTFGITAPVDLTYDISIDVGNGFEYLGEVNIVKNTIGAQQTLKLSNPIAVSGNFKLKLAASTGDQLVDISGFYEQHTMTAYVKNINDGGSDSNPDQDPDEDKPGGDSQNNPGEDSEEEIPVPSTSSGSSAKAGSTPNTGQNAEDSKNSLAALTYILPVIAIISGIGYIAHRSKRQVHFDHK